MTGLSGHNESDATIASPNPQRLALAVEYLTSLGYGSLVDQLAEYYAVSELKLEDPRRSSDRPVEANLSTTGVNIPDNEERLQNEGSNKLAKTADPVFPKPEAIESGATKPQYSIVISSSDHEESAVTKTENMRTGQATIRGHRNRFVPLKSLRQTQFSAHQRVREDKKSIQSYKISKPGSTVRRKSTTLMEERKLDGAKPLVRAKLKLIATAPPSSSWAKKTSIAEIVDLCSTDSENTPPKASRTWRRSPVDG